MSTMRQKTIGKWAYHDYNATRSRLNSQHAMVIRTLSNVKTFEPPKSVYVWVALYNIALILVALIGYSMLLGGK